MKKILKNILILFNIGCSSLSVLETVDNVDLDKYSGKWYEIASYPQFFQKDCYCSTAEYTPMEGYIAIKNKCRKDSINGREDEIDGKAFVVENSGNAKLKVQFFFPIKGDYWIIDLADNYSYAVVSNPTMKYLWILSRTPHMEDETYTSIVNRLRKRGFDLNKLKITNNNPF